jgi:hypothetical protein
MKRIVESWLGPPTPTQPPTAREEALSKLFERLTEIDAAWKKAGQAAKSYAIASSSRVLTDAGMIKNWLKVGLS